MICVWGMMRAGHRFAQEGAFSSRGSMTAGDQPWMPAHQTPLPHDCTRLLLVDTDNLFLDDVGGDASGEVKGVHVVATDPFH
jgi:hypothetical protein